MLRAGLTAIVFLAAGAAPALAGDRELLFALNRNLGPTVQASQAAARGSPSRVQTHYDRARDLQESVRAAAPFSGSCAALGTWASRYAAAEVASAEGFDRLDPAMARRWRRVAGSARKRIAASRQSCRPGPARSLETVPPLTEPRPWSATFGEISARAPSGTETAMLYTGGASAGPLAVGKGQATARLTGRAARYDLEARFERGSDTIGIARSTNVWLLPASADGAILEPDIDAGWQAELKKAAGDFRGMCGVWIHELATGRAAAWNAGAEFPAASTVKLGVLVAALRGMGPQPEQSARFHDVRALATWSSNLASNRLLARVGGPAEVTKTLRRMGATSSTFTGPYTVATELPPVDAPAPPPRVSGRMTTAYDMGSVMRAIHGAALGERDSLAATGMTRTQARLALGLLLSSEPSGDNLGILRDALGPDAVAAQKHGWISSARHSVAIVYTSRGPVVIAVLTYKRGLRRADAASLGAAAVKIATSP